MTRHSSRFIFEFLELIQNASRVYALMLSIPNQNQKSRIQRFSFFSDIRSIQEIVMAARLGQLCLICYDISTYSHLIIWFNRFTSVYFPTHYNAMFTDRCTTVLTIATVVMSVTISLGLVLVSCQVGFSAKQWMLDYVTSLCNTVYVYYSVFVRGLVIISVFAVVNACTFIKMNFYRRRKQVRQNQNSRTEKTLRENVHSILHFMSRRDQPHRNHMEA
ncbi:unnamed protein product [Angiostrongylus costaricensis]|uniref:7TM_GPCR_Srx domain-containing protein n=1 Tax=Angiostrongylus costaricensis TaxID=334426 RepID=A0A0R3PID1_ANGCS|nr:unnamed protein product [Angiostrongylus costaricensis]